MRALIVDDEPISLHFFESALRQLGVETCGARSIAGALATAQSARLDLLLLDQRLPEGSGLELLAALRAVGVTAPAVATSAEIDSAAKSQLRAAGFADCIEKPATLEGLAKVLAPWLPDPVMPQPVPSSSAAELWLDDSAALSAIGGDRQALRGLRALLAEELTTLIDDLQQSAVDTALLLERLHRLRAACGFCGAQRLSIAAATFNRSLRADSSAASAVQPQFLACCRGTLVALHNEPR